MIWKVANLRWRRWRDSAIVEEWTSLSLRPVWATVIVKKYLSSPLVWYIHYTYPVGIDISRKRARVDMSMDSMVSNRHNTDSDSGRHEKPVVLPAAYSKAKGAITASH